jgi:NAD(P)H-flavin reductase/ferredoxin/truncated hemoglobin YjbI
MACVRYRDYCFETSPGETLLEAMLRLGLPASFSCRAGSCHVCMMRAVEGSVPESAQRGISPALARLGYFLPCQCKTVEPLVIELPDPAHLCRDALVAEKLLIRPDLAVFRLEASPEPPPRPGQYVVVVHPDGERRPYSLASRPEHDYFFELHVRRIDRGKVSHWLVDDVSPGDTIRIQAPAGSFTNRNSPDGQKLLLIGTGTGLSPLLPILGEALERSSTAGIWLFHGGRHRGDLYADDRLRRLADQEDRFHYFGCCSRQAVNDPLLSGRVTEWIENFLPDLSGFKVFVAGHPEMVADVSALCSTLGVDPAVDLITDAFEFNHARVNDTWEDSTIRMKRSAPPPDPDLWSQLGNGAILKEVLRDFYEIAFEDDRLGPFFVGVTQQRLREKQYSFLRSLMLGTRDYLGQRPRNAHHWMVISDDLFDYRLERMTDCMRAHGLSEALISRWHAFEEFFRADIVKHQPIARTLNGQPLRLDGFEDMTLDEGTLCDACIQGIDAGSRVRVNLRLGTVYCRPCFNLERGPGSDRPEA